MLWEYVIEGNVSRRRLAELGAEGWELISAVMAEDQGDDPEDSGLFLSRAVFKRPLAWSKAASIKKAASIIKRSKQKPYPYPEEQCPGHVASANDNKVCGRCGIHINSLRPDDDD